MLMVLVDPKLLPELGLMFVTLIMLYAECNEFGDASIPGITALSKM